MTLLTAVTKIPDKRVMCQAGVGVAYNLGDKNLSLVLPQESANV